MSKKQGAVILILSILALIVSCVSISLKLFSFNSAENAPEETAEVTEQAKEEDIQYVLYLGTNDKDTNEPVFSPEEAKEKAEEILLRHFGGYTIQEANGGWIDGDMVFSEYTLVIYLSDTNAEAVHKAADEMISVFNQSSVLIQANRTATEFYAGTGDQ